MVATARPTLTGLTRTTPRIGPHRIPETGPSAFRQTRVMHTLLLRIRESFWFLPAVLGIGAIVLAELLVLLDRSLVDAGTRLTFLDALSASGGRSVLTTIGTAMLTVAGTSFSITISVLATTSSTYGPRLVRNFMADRANQFVLAAFTSTFLYAMVVLRSVHTAVDDGDAFVPVVAIHVAVLLGVVDVAVLVFFIHHIASSTQITSLQEQVQTDLEAVVDAVYRDGDDEGVRTGAVTGPPADGCAIVVRTAGDGYVQSVHWAALVSWAADHDARIDVVAMPGDHVIVGDPVWRVTLPDSPDRPADDGTERDGTAGDRTAQDRAERALRGLLRSSVALGSARTPLQDVGFALQQLVEIAMRGLASGTNDPYTAVSALDLSATALVPLWRGREPVTAYCDDDGGVRVVPRWPAVVELVDSVFASVLTYGSEHPIVLEAAVRLARRLEDVAPERRRGLLEPTLDALQRARG